MQHVTRGSWAMFCGAGRTADRPWPSMQPRNPDWEVGQFQLPGTWSTLCWMLHQYGVIIGAEIATHPTSPTLPSSP